MSHHKDHLTASCPHFQARNDYQCGHWIQCAMGRKGFKTAWERNQYYKNICCNDEHDCEIMNIQKGRRPKL